MKNTQRNKDNIDEKVDKKNNLLIYIIEKEAAISNSLKKDINNYIISEYEDQKFKKINIENTIIKEEEILKKFQEKKPSFVIIDMFLNDYFDGIKIAKALRDQKYINPIIFLNNYGTGNGFPKDEINEISGPYEIIDKPIHYEKLHEIIDNILN